MQDNHIVKTTDFLIIGSGIAGLSLALGLSHHGRVTLVTKKTPADSNTNLAQGGIATVWDAGDDFSLHVEDTLRVGGGLCHRDVVEEVVREGPERVRDLLTLGVPFTVGEDGKLALGLEGGHSRNRIVRCDDLTGRAVEATLLSAVADEPNVEMLDYHMAVDLITARHLEIPAPDGVYGAYVLDSQTGEVMAIRSRRTVLATGGAGKVYRYTTNPDIATGDGVAMAYRAGARIANLEFVQFHPTCLFHPDVKAFLLSEAMRGEGGKLLRHDGARFMPAYDDRAELAPRDIVARAIDAEMKRHGDECVYLDMTHLDRGALEKRFPNIYQRVRELGIDMSCDPIPVVPATHYFCGGVDVDLDGKTSVANLFAVGEVSHTGLHGANRLASNSLLEALVFARRAFHAIRDTTEPAGPPRALPWDKQGTDEAPSAVILEHDWDEARRVMWDYVGIVRSDQRLRIARERMLALENTVHALYWNSRVTQDLVELRNIILVGRLIVACARSRRESRGLHFTESYPHSAATLARDTVIEPGRGPQL